MINADIPPLNKYYAGPMEIERFCGITPEKLDDLYSRNDIGIRYSVKTVSNFYRRGIHCFRDMENLPGSLRRFLSFTFSSGLYPPEKYLVSEDGTVKYLFLSPSGLPYETVLIPEGERNTLCISTQSGCRMGCPFCMTGKSGFRGNLSAGDIINQVISVKSPDTLTHIVFMGMGEPMDNIDEVLLGCKILTSQWGLAFSSRNITVSTVGLAPGITRYLEESDCNLTLSLFSPFPDERSGAVPVERVYPAREIIEIIKSSDRKRKRRFTVAYMMIKDINDTPAHLEELIKLLIGSIIRVNLLPYHSLPGDRFVSSGSDIMENFRKRLLEKGISASVRKSRGEDISAACGLLANGFNVPVSFQKLKD